MEAQTLVSLRRELRQVLGLYVVNFALKGLVFIGLIRKHHEVVSSIYVVISTTCIFDLGPIAKNKSKNYILSSSQNRFYFNLNKSLRTIFQIRRSIDYFKFET
jgi:hypothetical protein